MPENKFKNRVKEFALFEELYKSEQPKLIIFYGRRRVGKTELLKKFLNKYSYGT